MGGAATKPDNWESNHKPVYRCIKQLTLPQRLYGMIVRNIKL